MFLLPSAVLEIIYIWKPPYILLLKCNLQKCKVISMIARRIYYALLVEYSITNFDDFVFNKNLTFNFRLIS